MFLYEHLKKMLFKPRRCVETLNVSFNELSQGVAKIMCIGLCIGHVHYNIKIICIVR